MAAAGLLSACGGGGSGSAPEPSNAAAVSVSMSGTAATGLRANADVTAHAVNADGTVATEVLARATTDAQGHYSLTFQGTQAQPYVIKVTANDKTTHLDEVTGTAQPLPVGFAMRSVFVPTGTGTVTTSVSVTPFSEMLVAAAAKAGGLSSDNVTKARTTVQDLLGFDPTAVDVKRTSDATATPEQQKLAIMLTAVSQMAKAGTLGCGSSGSAGQVTQCVVQKLADAASTTTLSLGTVSGTLASAVTTVLGNDTLRGQVVPTLLTSVQSNLGCTDASCVPVTPSTPSTPADVVTPAIAAAKSLFDNVRSDWRELFGSGLKTDPTAPFQTQASKFEQSMRDVQAPVEMAAKDLGALLMGIELYNDVKAGRTNMFSRGRAPGAFTGDNFMSTGYNAVGCTLVQDANGATTATSATNANFISCRASYYTGLSYAPGSTVQTLLDWAHGFTLTPSATTAGTFTYSSRARYRPVAQGLNGQFNPSGSSVTLPGTQPYSGTIETTFTTDPSSRPEHVTGFTASGDLPGAFAMGGTTLVSKSHSWSLSGTRSITAANDATSSLAGTVVARNADDSTQATLQIKSASLTEMPVSRDAAGNTVAPTSTAAVAAAGGEIATGAFYVVWSTPGAEFEGSIAASDSGWDKSLTLHAPTKVEIAGALRTVDGSAKTEFFSGKLTLSAAGLAQYDDQLPNSSGNFVTVSASLQGTATAPNRPQLELTAGTSMKSYEKEPSLVTVAYRSLVNGTPTMAVNLTASRNAAGAAVLSLSEAASNLSLTVTEGSASADLLLGGSTVVGRLTTKDYLLTFVDGTFVSLDLGL
jgi:hypothetical protein